MIFVHYEKNIDPKAHKTYPKSTETFDYSYHGKED